MPFTNSGDAGTTAPPRDRKAPASSRKPRKEPLFVTMLVWVITAIIGAFIFANIKPYEIIAANFLSGISYQSLGDVVFSIPFLGGIIKLLLRLANFSLGTLFWAFVQMLELLPLVLFGHGNFLDNNISRSGGQRYGANSNDSWEVKVAKYIGNSLSTEVLRFLILLGISVYVADFFLCLMVFPPVQGGNTADLLMVMQTGQFTKIDWGNIGKAIASLGSSPALTAALISWANLVKSCPSVESIVKHADCVGFSPSIQPTPSVWMLEYPFHQGVLQWRCVSNLRQTYPGCWLGLQF
ncbi:MAG: hypothetical protein QNJ36_17400 [Calothrix sp. MO_167.B42]|nr:hypothetical protein [Calothrix sp. MO_167.B42]